MKPKWYSRKWVNISLHVLAWAFFFFLPVLLHLASGPPSHRKDMNEHQSIFNLGNILLYAAAILIFYANALLFLPRLIRRKRVAEYVLSQVVIIAVLMWQWSPFAIFFYITVVACSSTFYFIREKIETEQLVRERENENLKTELSLLRSQVSPHFMFNVLNNMVALARKQSEKLEPSLIKLSSLMRYMLYEANEDKVPLEKEIEYLQSYIDLQQQRFGKAVRVDFAMNIAEPHHYIEPMLLIPFVENAFKHGTGMVENATISIHLEVNKNKLNFTVKNRFSENEEVKDNTSGIGLANVRRRLNLLYRNRHVLKISNDDNMFTIRLEIQLS